MAEGSVGGFDFLLVTLDPGQQAGLAVFKGPSLVWCGLNELPPYGGWCYGIFWEKPQINGQTEGKDPNAIVTEAVTAGRWLDRLPRQLGAACAFERSVFPVQWKASVPKKIHNARVLAKLAPEELAILKALKLPVSKEHNVIDAIGLGLFALGRMGRGA